MALSSVTAASPSTTECASLDPVSGHFLVLSDGGAFYEYNPTTDSWRGLPGTPLPNKSSQSIVATPISNYGVTLFVTKTKVYLYKHSN